MRFFKNKNILFKLIVALLIVLMGANFGSQSRVYAVHTKDDDHGEIERTDGYITFYEDGCYYDGTPITGQGWSLVQEDDSRTSDLSGTATEAVTGANSDDDAEQSEAMQGGKLLQPVVDLLLTLGDAVMDIIQKAIVGTDGHITLDLATSIIIKVFGILAAIAVIVVISIATAGIGSIVAGIGGIVGSALTAIGSSSLVTLMISGATILASLSAYNFVVDGFSGAFLPDITVLPTYSVSPQEIFEGKLLIFDINFFDPKEVSVGKDENGNEYYYYTDGDGEEVRTSKQSSSFQLSKVIAKWYYTIRNIALIIMMLVLIYVGIRMMLSSIASEKSKYKKMLGDWVISMCLVFVFHYIMVFAVNVNENIVDMMESATEKNISFVEINLDKMDSNKKKNFLDAIEKSDEDLKQYLTEDESAFIYPTNLVGRMRILCQMQNGSSEYVGYAIAYIVLVLYTVFFTFTYLKRVLYMAFLTVIAPLVAMTYSIDKISDGKAQAFNMWLKEYIFNLLIQPVHLLLYMLLISMAFDLAGQNIIYTLVAIGFMIPAEKLIRKMFGFEKASTPGFLGGATGAALTMSGMQSLARLAGKGPGPKGGVKQAGKLDKTDDDPNGIYNRGADSGNNMSNLFANENDNNPIDALGGPTQLNDGGNNQHTPSNNERDDRQENDLPDYEDIRLAEQNANPMDFLNEDERREYDIANARAGNSSLEFSELSSANRRKKELEANAAKRKTAHFQQERANRRMLEESQRRQQEAQAEAARRQRLQEKSQTKLATFGRIASNGFKDAISKENIGNAVATTVKTGTKLTGAVLGGAVGAATGIASGDMSKVAQNMALGATAGNSIGTATGNAVVGGVTSGIDKYKQGKIDYEKERYGEEYSQHHKTELDEKFKKDREARQFFERECRSELEGLSGKARKEKLDEIMDEAIIFRQHGVTDNTLIVKARNLDRSDRTSSESIAAAMMASQAKDLKGIEPYQKRLAKQVGNERAEKIANKAAKLGGWYE